MNMRLGRLFTIALMNADNEHMNNASKTRVDKILQVAIWTTIGIGMVLRLIIFFQNRNLILDEANIARNLFERSFLQLLQPLSYEQYAPPVFLWIEKLNANILGFGEYSLRSYPLLTGLLSLIVFKSLLRSYVDSRTTFYGVLLLSISYMFIRYSSEVKQYMPDVLIVLSLLLLAVKVSILNVKSFKFVLIWCIAGSVAIWASMPSVFALTGIGCYYMYILMSKKETRKIPLLIICGILWLAQFALYYYTILQPQINSDYLQNFHQYDFLYATPATKEEWVQNWTVIANLIRQFAGCWPYLIFINLILTTIGAVTLLVKNTARGVLIIIPITCVIIAAALNQFSLMTRVALFFIPLLLIVNIYGAYWLLSSKRLFLKTIACLICLATIGSQLNYTLIQRWKYEELTKGLEYLKRNSIAGDYTYLYHATGPALIYYTTIHPNKKKWTTFEKAEILKWNTQYGSLSWEMTHSWLNKKPVAFVFTNAIEEQVEEKTKLLEKFLKLISKYEDKNVRCYIYSPVSIP